MHDIHRRPAECISWDSSTGGPDNQDKLSLPGVLEVMLPSAWQAVCFLTDGQPFFITHMVWTGMSLTMTLSISHALFYNHGCAVCLDTSLRVKGRSWDEAR